MKHYGDVNKINGAEVDLVMDKNDSWAKGIVEKYLKPEVPPVELGNKNKTGECGMCGVKVKKLTYQKVGQVEFMICENCKSIMDMC